MLGNIPFKFDNVIITSLQLLANNLPFSNIDSVLIFEKEIIFSERLTFMYNYYKKLSSLVDDLKYYASKEEWDSYEMEIKK